MFEDLAKLISILFIMLLLGFALLLADFKIAYGAEITKLIKTERNPAIYAIIENKKHPIPNKDIFISYGYKWKDVKTVSQEVIESYPNARLVKIPNNPTVYYLNYKRGLKKAHPSEQVFLNYGNKWNDIITINEKDLAFYKNVKLVKTKNSLKIYLLEGEKRRLVLSPAVLKNMGYEGEQIIEISSLDLESYTLDNLNEENPKIELANKIIPEINTLQIAIISDTQASKYIPTGAISEFGKISLKGIKGTSLINGLTISSFGLTKSTDIEDIFLTLEGDENYSYYKTSFNEKKAVFYFPQALKIKKGENKILTIKASLKSDEDSAYRTISLGIADSKDIFTTSEISGSFPLLGPLKEMRNGNDSLGQVEIESLTINWNNIEVNKGAKNQKVASFKIRETSGSEDIFLKGINFKVQGNIAYNDLINIDLVDDNGRILQTATWMQKDRVLEYNLEKNPLRINKKNFRSITLQADINGYPNREFRFLIESSGDIKIIGASSNLQLVPKASSSEGKFPIGLNQSNNYNKITIREANMLVYLSEESPSEVIAGSKNALLSSFNFISTNSNIKLNKFNLTFDYTGTPLQASIDLINSKSKEKIFSIGSEVLLARKTIEVNLQPAITIEAGKSIKVEVRADIPYNLKPETIYNFNLWHFEFEDIESKITNTKLEQVQSKNLIAKSSILYIIPNKIQDEYTSGSKNIKLGSFTLQANPSEDLYIKSVQIKAQGGYSSISYPNGYYNVRLNLGGNKIDQPLNFPLTFIFNYPYRISAGSSINLEVYSDTYPTVGENISAISISDIDLYGGQSKAKPIVMGLESNSNPIKLSRTTLELAQNNEFNIEEVNCGKNIKIGSFKMRVNNAEKIRVKEISLAETSESDTISYLTGYKNLRLVNNLNGYNLASISGPVPDFNTFRTEFAINAGEEIIIDIYIDIPEQHSGQNLQLMVRSIGAQGYSSAVTPAINNSLIILNKIKVKCITTT